MDAVNLGVDLAHCTTENATKLCVSDIVPAPGHRASYDWGPVSDLWINTFTGDEKDCLNQ